MQDQQRPYPRLRARPVALNVDMDLSPFLAIDPCGYPGLAVTQTRDLGIKASAVELGDRLAAALTRLFEQHER